MAEQDASAKPAVSSDEEWKERVRAENAALEEKLKGDAQPSDADSQSAAAPVEPTEHAIEDPPPELPPPTFYTLVGMFSTQAMVSLGLIPHPVTGKPDVQLPLARHFIDMLAVLEDKTTGNLDENEQALLTQTLHQFRIAFVEISKQQPAVAE